MNSTTASSLLVENMVRQVAGDKSPCNEGCGVAVIDRQGGVSLCSGRARSSNLDSRLPSRKHRFEGAYGTR